MNFLHPEMCQITFNLGDCKDIEYKVEGNEIHFVNFFCKVDKVEMVYIFRLREDNLSFDTVRAKWTIWSTSVCPV